MSRKMTIPQLHRMKRDGKKIVGIVVWDYQMARIAERAGADIISVGDSVGVNLWGRTSPLDVTLDEMLLVARAVRRGARHALVSCDFPYGPLQEGPAAALRAALRLIKEAGVDMVKLDGAAEYLETVAELTRAGIPVWAQFGITPQTTLQHGLQYAELSGAGAEVGEKMQTALVESAEALERAGAALLDFTNSGPVVGPVVAKSVMIPVIGGFGGGPWLDGRVRMAHAAIGYGEKYLDGSLETYANVGQTALEALAAFGADVRAGRQIKGAPPAPVGGNE